MKYKLFMALATAGLLTGCSSNDMAIDDEDAPIPIPPKEELVELNIGAGSPSTTTSRSLGTVGGKDEETNVWKKQTLWLFMTDKGTVKPAQFITSDGSESLAIKLFNNKRMTAPDGVASGEMKTVDGAVNYYPMSGTFDFYGYHIDDAAVDGEGNAIDLTDTSKQPAVKFVNTTGGEVDAKQADKIIVPFKINGTQDLMAGKATLSEADKELLAAEADHYYSAYSARRKVTPDVQFKHLLTRLTFSVIAGDKASAGQAVEGQDKALTKPLTVEAILVKSATKGAMTVAYKETPENFLSWDEDAEMEWCDLKEKSLTEENGPLTTLTAKSLEWDNETSAGKVLPLGEALLVQPGVTSYDINVKVSQWVQININEPEAAEAGTNKPADYTEDNKDLYPGTWSLVNHVYPTSINLSDNSAFQPGTSYNVKIYLSGLTKIDVKASLNKWVEGEEIETRPKD